jgi:hypothetical protein
MTIHIGRFEPILVLFEVVPFIWRNASLKELPLDDRQTWEGILN